MVMKLAGSLLAAAWIAALVVLLGIWAADIPPGVPRLLPETLELIKERAS